MVRATFNDKTPCMLNTVIIQNILTADKFAVFTLKFEQDGFTIE